MKRSEMIDLISKFLDKPFIRSSASCRLGLAEKLLNELEKAGMIPPAVSVKQRGRDGKIVIHQWESEDA